MTEDTKIELTRRKILAGLGGVGLASAGAGLGTSAFLNDTEGFENNTITAGSLDLKVDWEEHYSYPQLYGFDDPTAGLDVRRTEPAEPAVYVGLPDPESPVVWVHQDDLGQYMANTAIEAFPDPDNDGEQEIETDSFTYTPCSDGADTSTDLVPSDGGATRTENAGTWNDEEGTAKPLVSLDDVKPGDFGEFTLSFHLCDNPGYVWLQADNVSQAENGINDPESEVDDSPETAELAENIRTAWWYDDGNNVVDETVGKVDVMLAVDTSGSLTEANVNDLQSSANQLADDLVAAGDARVGGLTFGDSSIGNFTGLADGPVEFSGLSPGGNTPTPAALEIAAAELDENGRPDADTFIVMFTDGGPNYPNQTYSAGGHTVGGDYTGGNAGNATVDDSELEETAGIAAAVREEHRILAVGVNDDRKPTGREGDDPSDIFGTGTNGYLSTYIQNHIAGSMSDYFQAESAGTVSDLLDAILEEIAMTEEVFHRGTLADDLAVLSDGDGIPLDGNLTTAFDEIEDEPDADSRECFDNGVTSYVGFAWWLPADVGNEVQGDSVSFDLGFYAEQCRHNDGSGTEGEAGT
jgi:predicted ribosomally synthesized peptide with SipW-like signal peptide